MIEERKRWEMTLVEYGALMGYLTVIHRVRTVGGNELNIVRGVLYSDWCERYEPIEDEI